MQMSESYELDLHELLETGLSVLLEIDTTLPGVIIPKNLKHNPTVRLEIGYNLGIPIPDLELNDDGVNCTLTFKKGMTFACFLPWACIIGYSGDAVRDFLSNRPEKNVKSTTKRDANGKIIIPSWMRIIK